MSEYPSDWTRTTFGNVLNQRKEAGFMNEELLAVTSSLGIVKRDTLERRDTSNEDKSKYLLVNVGDIAYNTMRMWQGVSGVSRFRGIVSPAYTICTPTERLDANFAGYMLKDPQMVSVFRQRSQGLVSDTWNLKYESFAQIPCVIPPLPEQKKIAEILSGIDKYINVLRQEILKLDTAGNAFSKELLTEETNSSKDSLYGKIPSHWGESTLAEVLGGENLQTGPFGSQLHAHEYTREGIPVIMPQDMRNCAVITDKIARIPLERTTSLQKHKVEVGDILFSRRGDIGRHALISDNEKGWICGTGCLRARPRGRMNPMFLSELLGHRFALEWLNANAVGQTMLNLNTSILGQLPVIVPPIDEQKRIACFLDSISVRGKKIAGQAALAEKLKAALAADLLSGRKRVSI